MTEKTLEKVQNKLIIRADSFRCLKNIAHSLMGNESLLDFNKITKTPEDLKAISVGRTLSKGGHLLTEWLEDDNGNVSELSPYFRSYLTWKFGYTNWRDWRRENWGTIWNPKDILLTQVDRYRIEYQFLTVHPPEGIIKKLVSKEALLPYSYAGEKVNIVWSIYGKEGFPRIFSNFSEDN